MKQTLFGCVCFMITFFTVLIVITVCGQANIQNEISNDLDYSVESALNAALSEHGYTVNDTNELIADVLERLIIGANDNATLSISIKGADKDMGILSLVVTEEYTTILGKTKTESVEKTVILEHYDLEQKKMYTVTFAVNNFVYKQYELTDGSKLIIPKNPNVDGYEFLGWTNEFGEDVNINEINNVDKSYVFIAKMQLIPEKEEPEIPEEVEEEQTEEGGNLDG